MSFLEPVFLFQFLPLALLLFYGAGRLGGPDAAAMAFTAIAIVFCLPLGWRFTALVLASAVLNWMLCARLAAPGGSDGARRALLYGGVATNLVILAFFKYLPAFTALPGVAAMTTAIALWVPITISFYTFQRLVLLVDCHRRDPAALALVGGRGGSARFLAFTMGFPNLVIGPIAYAAELAGQMRARRFGRVRRSDLEVGLTLFVIGLFKKVVIADAIGADIVDPIFARLGPAGGQALLGPDAILGILGYYAQLYFDFSGYSDMALGLARMFGLRLPFNFNSPLHATGIVDFYRRWHITLTRIVSRFLFQPLALRGTRFTMRRRWKGPRRKPLELWLPLLVNFLVIGIWHGATWTFVVFGLIHGTWYIIETEVRSTRRFKQWAKRSSDALRTAIGQAITIVPLALTFALFRSASLGQFGALVQSTATDWPAFFHAEAGRIANLPKLALLGAAFAIIWLAPNAMELLSRYRPGIVTFPVPSRTPRLLALRWQPTLIWGLYIAALMGWVLKSRGAPAPFVYGGF